MYTYQDYLKASNKNEFISTLIAAHLQTEEVRIAKDADAYDRRQNSTIVQYVKTYYTLLGEKKHDKTASNNKLCSNFFNRLNTQRNTYSLGNGIEFAGKPELKDKLGASFDTEMLHAGYFALIHGTSFIFWNMDHIHVFKLTEFAPLFDEEDGSLRAGVRFWQVAADRPMYAVFYEEDGYTKYKSDTRGADMDEIEAKRGYRMTLSKAPADAEPEIVGMENYGSLPIIPLYGSRLKQSTLIGMKAEVDAFDLVRSGFANDMEDCAEVYWIISNADGMNDNQLKQFRDRLKYNHIAKARQGDVTPYTQQIPHESREAFLTRLHNDIYENFGGLDVHSVEASSTNDHLEAAYQPMDENADDFEYQLIEAVHALLSLIGEEDTPIFKRNRISNTKEQTEMVLEAAQYLDSKTILKKLPFITIDEVDEIMEAIDAEDFKRSFDESKTEEEGEDAEEVEEDEE